MYRAKARRREVNEVEEGEVVEEKEVLEIYTSFWPETTTYITADKLEQVLQITVANSDPDETFNFRWPLALILNMKICLKMKMLI